MPLNRIMMFTKDLFAVPFESLVEELSGLFGPAVSHMASNLPLDDVRAGRTVAMTSIVPAFALSETLREHVKAPYIKVRAVVTPRMVQTGTQTVTIEDGPTIEAPVYERQGTLIDLWFEPEEVDVAGLKTAMQGLLQVGTETRSDGTEIPVLRTAAGLTIVDEAAVRTPSQVLPWYEEPRPVTDPPVDGTPAG